MLVVSDSINAQREDEVVLLFIVRNLETLATHGDIIEGEVLRDDDNVIFTLKKAV